MGDLEVDFEVLEDSHRTAASLKKEFDGLPDAVKGVAWGRSSIADAMDTFGNNWSYHREILSDKLGEVGEKIESCLTTFRDADRQLYDQLVKNEGGN